MRLVFKRDEDGRETIVSNGVVVAVVKKLEATMGATVHHHRLVFESEVDDSIVVKAIAAANEAGFWAMRDAKSFSEIVALLGTGVDAWINDEVTVDVT